MKSHLLRFTVASPPIVSARPHGNRSALLGAGFLCFALAINACNQNDTAQSDESGTSMAHQSKSKTTGERRSHELVKELFLVDRRQGEALAEQRRQSIRELSTSALVTSIRSLNPVDEPNDRAILPKLFLALAEKDPIKLFEMLNDLPGEYYKIAMSESFPYLAKENPEFLQSYVLISDFQGERDRWMMIGACEVLGKENPGKALNFFDEMSDEKKQGHLGTMLLKQAASEEPNLVVDFLSRRRTSPYFTDLFRDVLYTVLVNDPSFALKLASSYPEVQNTHLSAGIYASMARKNPKSALEEMSNASPEVRVEIFTRRNFDNKSYFSKLFSEDPAKTMNLLNGIIPSTANSHLFEEAANRLSSLPTGSVRDSSVRSFAEVIRPVDPETADRWIESLR